MNNNDTVYSFTQAVAMLYDKRLLWVFLLGFSSGFPWVMIGSTLYFWLNDVGLSFTKIGLAGSIAIVYALNFLWSPLLDRLQIPILTKKLGSRKSWIMLMQWLIVVATIAMSLSDPELGLRWTILFALLLATASATQDIAIDAYRIEIIGDDEASSIPHAAAVSTCGWWSGLSLPGAFALWFADQSAIQWPNVYLVLAGLMLCLPSIMWIIQEPKSNRMKQQQISEARYQKELQRHHFNSKLLQRWFAWWAVTIVEPLSEFFHRNGWKLALAVLGFIFLFKIGEAFLGRMAPLFYKSIGFSTTDIAIYSKLFGWWIIIIFSLVTAILNARFGFVRSLMISGIAMAVTNLMFSWLAVVGPNTTIFAAAVIVDNITASISTVTFVSFISHLTSRVYTAAQYALMASLGNLGRTTLASFSGIMIDQLNGDWFIFFILTALMVIPALLLLWWIGSKVKNL